MDIASASDGPWFVGIKFCQEYNDMLYPKEDKQNKRLLYSCRNSDFQMEADIMCVYVNKIAHEVNECIICSSIFCNLLLLNLVLISLSQAT